MVDGTSATESEMHECPLCARMFPERIIVEHASECQGLPQTRGRGTLQATCAAVEKAEDCLRPRKIRKPFSEAAEKTVLGAVGDEADANDKAAGIPYEVDDKRTRSGRWQLPAAQLIRKLETTPAPDSPDSVARMLRRARAT